MTDSLNNIKAEASKMAIQLEGAQRRIKQLEESLKREEDSAKFWKGMYDGSESQKKIEELEGQVKQYQAADAEAEARKERAAFQNKVRRVAGLKGGDVLVADEDLSPEDKARINCGLAPKDPMAAVGRKVSSSTRSNSDYDSVHEAYRGGSQD